VKRFVGLLVGIILGAPLFLHFFGAMAVLLLFGATVLIGQLPLYGVLYAYYRFVQGYEHQVAWQNTTVKAEAHIGAYWILAAGAAVVVALWMEGKLR
jgi:hypothetical protein